MGLYALTAAAVQGILRNKWGVKLEGPDGERHDTGVQPFVEEMANRLSSRDPIQMAGTLELIAPVNGPAITIYVNVNGDSNNENVIQIVDVFNDTTINVQPDGFTGSLQVVDGVTGSVAVNGCDVTVSLNLSYKTLNIRNGMISGVS